MGINPQAPLQEGKSVQYLAGFIYTDDGQAAQLPDGTLVRGRCQTASYCSNAAGDRLNLDKASCVGVCTDPQTDNVVNIDPNTDAECTSIQMDWEDYTWVESVVLNQINTFFECENNSPYNEWISYAGTKYIESDFFPGEEWRRQVGYRWGNLASMSADGFIVPVSTQFRKPVGGCFKFACSLSAHTDKTSCEASGGKWEASKLPAVCLDSNGDVTSETTEAACLASNPSNSWVEIDYSGTCKDYGGCWLDDAGDNFDLEIPEGFLPSFYSPNITNLVGSGTPTVVTLNPFASGHNVTVVSRDKELNPRLGDAAIRKADYGEQFSQLGKESLPNDNTASSRPVALRGPVIVAGWGYDDLNQPVPNEYYDADEFTMDSDGGKTPVYPGHCLQAGRCDDDQFSTAAECPADKWTAHNTKEDCQGGGMCDPKGECGPPGSAFVPVPTNNKECTDQGGTWTAYPDEETCDANGGNWTTGLWQGVPQNKNPNLHFYFNHLKRPDKWKVGPIDLRWDRERKVWIAASPLKISLCKATRCILPQAGSDGKNSFNFGILDNINSPGRLYRNPCSYADCGFGTYFPRSPMYPDIEIYDPEDYEWCGNCKVKKDAGGNYFVTCEDFHSTCVPFYDAIVMRDMKHYVFGNDRSLTSTGHHHDTISGDTDCGDKFSKTHRGDPYNRRMGNPCHEFGNSIEGEQIPLAANTLYPREAKSVLYQRVLIENPLGQGLMVGDSFLSADTGKRITIEYVRKKEGTGSSNCTGANASPETVKESLPVHIILQGEFYGQEILTSMGCEQGEASACSKKIMVQGMTTMEDCGPNDDYPQSATAY